MRHREAWAVEVQAPSAAALANEQANSPVENKPTPQPRSNVAASPTSAPAVVRRAVPSAPSNDAELEREILIVASKLKKYIRAKSGMNTSETVLDPLSDCVRAICDRAIRVAGTDGRKTVMDRDIRLAARE